MRDGAAPGDDDRVGLDRLGGEDPGALTGALAEHERGKVVVNHRSKPFRRSPRRRRRRGALQDGVVARFPSKLTRGLAVTPSTTISPRHGGSTTLRRSVAAPRLRPGRAPRGRRPASPARGRGSGRGARPRPPPRRWSADRSRARCRGGRRDQGEVSAAADGCLDQPEQAGADAQHRPGDGPPSGRKSTSASIPRTVPGCVDKKLSARVTWAYAGSARSPVTRRAPRKRADPTDQSAPIGSDPARADRADHPPEVADRRVVHEILGAKRRAGRVERVDVEAAQVDRGQVGSGGGIRGQQWDVRDPQRRIRDRRRPERRHHHQVGSGPDAPDRVGVQVDLAARGTGLRVAGVEVVDGCSGVAAGGRIGRQLLRRPGDVGVAVRASCTRWPAPR